MEPDGDQVPPSTQNYLEPAVFVRSEASAVDTRNRSMSSDEEYPGECRLPQMSRDRFPCSGTASQQAQEASKRARLNPFQAMAAQLASRREKELAIPPPAKKRGPKPGQKPRSEGERLGGQCNALEVSRGFRVPKA